MPLYFVRPSTKKFVFLTNLFVLWLLCADGVAKAADQPQILGVARISGISIGSRVRRGPDWKAAYGDQDGGRGRLGTVVELKSWRGSNETLGVRVRWDAGAAVNTYRWAIRVDAHDNAEAFALSATGASKAATAQSRGFRDLEVVGEVDITSPEFAEAAEEAARSVEASEAASAALDPITSPGQADLLFALFRACNGARWQSSRGWRDGPKASDPCRNNWEGVSCSGGTVIAIDLAGNGLSCPNGLPSQLGALRTLQSINLERNDIRGTLAQADLCANVNIRHINLGANQLTGPIPDCYAALPRLETLALHVNELTGRIPAMLLRRTGLKLLHLHGNFGLTLQREDADASRIPTLSLPAGLAPPRIKHRSRNVPGAGF